MGMFLCCAEAQIKWQLFKFLFGMVLSLQTFDLIHLEHYFVLRVMENPFSQDYMNLTKTHNVVHAGNGERMS